MKKNQGSLLTTALTILIVLAVILPPLLIQLFFKALEVNR